jgi:hypothetical protein
MIDNLAIRVLTARAGARILAFITQARSVGCAIRVENALWPTAFVRVSKVFGETSAGAGAVLFSAYGVGAARGWNAWRGGLFSRWRFRLLHETLHECIAGVSDGADAHRRVADHAAFRVRAARSGAGVFAFLIDTRQVTRAFAITDALGSTVRG